jgi:alanyl-tRNA synthetase
MIIEAHKAGVVAVLASNDEVSCRYLIMSSGMDLKDVCRTFNQKLNGKGGGRGVMVQGTYNVPASEAMRVLERELQ